MIASNLQGLPGPNAKRFKNVADVRLCDEQITLGAVPSFACITRNRCGHLFDRDAHQQKAPQSATKMTPDAVTVLQLESISPSELPYSGKGSLAKLANVNQSGTGEDASAIDGLYSALVSIQQPTARREEVYQRATAAVLQLTDLDEALVAVGGPGDWQVVSGCARTGNPNQQFNCQILDQVVQRKQTFFQTASLAGSGDSALDRNAEVASPILDSTNRVVAVVIGVRRCDSGEACLGVDRSEAILTALIAGGVSATQMREDGQANASRFQVQLEQFASPSLVRAMKDDPGILESQSREITVLFSDIRGFTGLSERVGAEKTFTMIRNLMNQLTGCILDEQGFIMGYAGDGIAAMWNAPADHPDHAELACWAAVNMQKVMSKLSQFWSFVSGEELAIRIGICTGKAQVGNAGSRWRLHYSPIGPCVNLASRLESANKYFGSSILITESTKELLFSSFRHRRIGPVVPKGTDRPTQVYQIFGEGDEDLPSYVGDYDAALDLFQKGQLSAANQMLLASISKNDRADQAALLLQAQIERTLATGIKDSPCIRLSEK